jgi:YgiT-type zinc finger domain-containing protein
MITCSIQGCSGEYKQKMIVHTLTWNDEFFVFENVPAEVCSVCGDTLLHPDTVRKIELLTRKKKQPERFVPVYQYS